MSTHGTNTRILVAAWFAAALLGGARTASAQDTLQATVGMGAGRASFDVELLGIEGNTVSMRGKKDGYVAKVPITQITDIEFDLPAPIRQGLRAAQNEKWLEAAQALHHSAHVMLPFLAVPRNNARPVIETYAQALLELDKIEEMGGFYSRMARVENAEVASLGSSWLGYLKAREGKFDEAAKSLDRLGTLDPDDEAFAVRETALCRVAIARNEFRKAADHIAKVVSRGALESRLFPEALHLSGMCYEGLAAEDVARQESERDKQIQLEVQAERVRVGATMQQEARDADAKPPTEDEIAAAVDRASIESSIPEVPPIEENRHARTAYDVYLLLARLYPDSEWTRKALPRVPQAAREREAAMNIRIDLGLAGGAQETAGTPPQPQETTIRADQGEP